MFDHTKYLQTIGRNGRTNAIETISFDEYFRRCINNPKLARNAVQRIYDMIMSHGTYVDDKGITRYNFFQGRIFGSEEPIQQIMEYFKAASYGLDIKKRVLLLLGPPGGGKSMILSMLKEGLRDYTRTEKGAMYKIKGCPINEEPLNLIEDKETRKELWNDYKIKIEGKLCPYCKYKLETDWKHNLSNVEVERCYIDEETRDGIGTFSPAEENDMTELYGSINLRKVEEYGDESDPRVYDFTGELQKANRGIMEFIEILKADPAFLHVLLTLAEEQQFKTPRFPLFWVDEALIAHTNEGEFIRFINVRENEAVVDRLYVVRVPYNLNPKTEELIYHSALKNKLVIDGVRVHPGAIRLASLFSVGTRYSEEKDELRDGMQGISPRFILNTIAIAMVKIKAINDVVTTEDMYKTLREQVRNYPVLDKITRTRYLTGLDNIYKKYKDQLENLTMKDVNLDELNNRGRNGFKLF